VFQITQLAFLYLANPSPFQLFLLLGSYVPPSCNACRYVLMINMYVIDQKN